MKIYISLPITGQEEKAREKAEKVKAMLIKRGWEVVNPFEVYCENPTYFDYLACDIRAMADCDAVYFCEGWQHSKGCNLEKAFADIFEKKIIFECNDVAPVFWSDF